MTITASNAVGTGQATIVMSVQYYQSTSHFMSSAMVYGTAGQMLSTQLKCNDYPYSFKVTNLPPD